MQNLLERNLPNLVLATLGDGGSVIPVPKLDCMLYSIICTERHNLKKCFDCEKLKYSYDLLFVMGQRTEHYIDFFF